MKIRYVGDLGGGIVLENGQFAPHGVDVDVQDELAIKILENHPKSFKKSEKIEKESKKKGGER